MATVRTNRCDECGRPISRPGDVCLILGDGGRRYRCRPATLYTGPIPYYLRVCRECANSSAWGRTEEETIEEGWVCRRCGRWIIGTDDLVMHHVSYADDYTVPMHRSCHTSLHQEIRRTGKVGILTPEDARPKNEKRYCECGNEIKIPRRRTCVSCWSKRNCTIRGVPMLK